MYEILVALHVDDPAVYTQYRAAIRPLLEAAGASFRYDFEVARTLLNGSPHPVNRVFVLRFPDQASKERFFADPHYRAIRSNLFDQAVSGTTHIGEYEADA